MTAAELSPDQLRRDPLPLRGRTALVTGVSRRAGIGYAVARRLAALGASLFLHHYAPHDRDQPWGEDPGGAQAMVAGVREVLAVAGRVMLMRPQGLLAFATLRDSSGQVQLFAYAGFLGHGSDGRGAQIFGVGAGEAHPADAVHPGHRPQQVSEEGPGPGSLG